MSEKTKPSDLKLLNRDEVTATLAPTENLEFTDLKPGDNLEVRFHGSKDEPVVDLGGRDLQIIPSAFLDVAKCVGLTRKYTGKCPANLLFPHLDYFFGEGMSAPIRAISQGDQLIGMTKDRVKTQVISNERLLRAAEANLGDRILGFHQVSTNLGYSRMGIVTDKSFTPLNSEPTDILYGGIQIQNSILGKDVVEVSPYIFRQWCSNGAISSERLGTFTRKKRGDGLDDWFHEIIGDADSKLDREFERISHLTSISVRGHIPEVLEGIRRDHHISKKIIEVVQDQATSSNVQTMYDLWNCITRVATHNETLSPMASSRLQNVAGHVTKNHELCSQCHRVLN